VSGSSEGGPEAGGIRVEREGAGGAVPRVTIARPRVRNALDAGAIAALRAAFQGFAEEAPSGLRAVVLAGEGRVFCAGADLGWMRAALDATPEANEADALGLASMYAAIDSCPVPVIARVQGAALGGGAGLCAVVDVTIAEGSAWFSFPEARLGLIPATIAPFVVARVGEGHARALFATGRRFGAAEALRIGLVHEVAEGPDALDRAVEAAVADVLASGPEATRAAKQLIRDLRGADPATAAERTARALAIRRASAEGAEGLRAIEERRSPSWVARSTG
jgi:methylglutaconyl-CoA hydratase